MFNKVMQWIGRECSTRTEQPASLIVEEAPVVVEKTRAELMRGRIFADATALSNGAEIDSEGRMLHAAKDKEKARLEMRAVKDPLYQYAEQLLRLLGTGRQSIEHRLLFALSQRTNEADWGYEWCTSIPFVAQETKLAWEKIKDFQVKTGKYAGLNDKLRILNVYLEEAVRISEGKVESESNRKFNKKQLVLCIEEFALYVEGLRQGMKIILGQDRDGGK